MMQANNHKPRRDFLKIISVSLVALGALPFMKARREKDLPEQQFKMLSKEEADQIIKNEKFPSARPVTPAPAPKGNMNIKE